MKFLGGVVAGLGLAHTMAFHNGYGWILVLIGVIVAAARW